MSAISPGRARIQSIDVIRGAVMVLMAVDHVRVFSGVPPGGPSGGVFFTRWITHFCAPAFVFLAGTGAFLRGRKLTSRSELGGYLLRRGALLVLLELTLMRFGWTFNLDYAHYVLAGVLWMIGWCMILMAPLVRLSPRVLGALGLALVALHNLADRLPAATLMALRTSPTAPFLQVLYFGGPVALASGAQLAVLYSIVPWIGVMAAGYAFGALLLLERERRRRLCLGIGLGATLAFAVLRGFNLYGNPSPWGTGQPPLPPVFSFLNTAKYPASLQFLLMTLGPTIALVPALEQAHGWLARVLGLFGRTPLLFYVLHIPLIHLLAMTVSVARTGGIDSWLFANHPMMNPPPPEGYTWPLWLLYSVTAVAVALLYPTCRWFEGYRAKARGGWSALF